MEVSNVGGIRAASGDRRCFATSSFSLPDLSANLNFGAKTAVLVSLGVPAILESFAPIKAATLLCFKTPASGKTHALLKSLVLTSLGEQANIKNNSTICTSTTGKCSLGPTRGFAGYPERVSTSTDKRLRERGHSRNSPNPRLRGRHPMQDFPHGASSPDRSRSAGKVSVPESENDVLPSAFLDDLVWGSLPMITGEFEEVNKQHPDPVLSDVPANNLEYVHGKSGASHRLHSADHPLSDRCKPAVQGLWEADRSQFTPQDPQGKQYEQRFLGDVSSPESNAPLGIVSSVSGEVLCYLYESHRESNVCDLKWLVEAETGLSFSNRDQLLLGGSLLTCSQCSTYPLLLGKRRCLHQSADEARPLLQATETDPLNFILVRSSPSMADLIKQ